MILSGHLELFIIYGINYFDYNITSNNFSTVDETDDFIHLVM